MEVTVGCFGVRGPGELAFAPGAVSAEVALCSELILVKASDLRTGSGGGKGEIDNEETEAV